MYKRIAVWMILLAGVTASCALPVRVSLSTDPAASPTPLATSTPAPTPTPLPTSTPLPSARLGEGERLLFVGDYAGALQSYQTALDQASDDDTRAGALVGIGRTQILLGDPQTAVTKLNEAITGFPQSSWTAPAFFFRAQANTALENYASAAADYQNYLSAAPGVLDATMQELRGDALMAAGDIATAILAYEAAAQAPQLGDPVFVKIKAARAYAAAGDNSSAVRNYMAIYDSSSNEYVRAQMNLLAGQIYTQMGLPEQAYARYQDSVNNYQRPYDTYSALATLVENGIEVNQLNRGIVDYYAGAYAVSVDALTRYLDSTPDHDGSGHYYKAMALLNLDRHEDAAAEFDALIHDHPGDRYALDAWSEKAYIQWAYQDHYDFAAETLLSFIRMYPEDPGAADMLFEAARIQERGGFLTEAANTWERMLTEYPAGERSYRALFLAGITRYRVGAYDAALTTFQRNLALAATPADRAAAYFWIGKTEQAMGDEDAAQASWDVASQSDPTGYYSERARNLLKGRPVLYAAENYDLGYDLAKERVEADGWLRSTFGIAPEVDLNGPADLSGEARFQRGDAFFRLGLYDEARDEFESLRQEISADPVATYRLMNHALDLGIYRTAIFASRQILDLADLDDASSLTAPAYFNHIRFGVYFRDQVLSAAKEEGIHPLLAFSLIRQESMFEGFVESSAGALGLMQIMPATGDEIVAGMGWPTDYTSADLTRPTINIRLGMRYLARQRDFFDGDLFGAIAGYNGGPGNSMAWKQLAGDDPDLFLELIRYEETRNYLTQISDFLNIYNRLYTREQ